MKKLAAILLLATLAVAAGLPGAEGHLTPAQTKDHIGEHATVCGKVESTKFLHSTEGQPTFLNFGGAYPRHKFTVVIWGRNRKKFGRPERDLRGKKVCVTGRIRDYRGRPEMEVTATEQVRPWKTDEADETAKEEKEKEN